MNLKKMVLAVTSITMLALAVPVHAQGGCVDSPEDPTIILALVGCAGAFAMRLWRSRDKHE